VVRILSGAVHFAILSPLCRPYRQPQVASLSVSARRQRWLSSSIWDMPKFGEVFSSRLPIIVSILSPSTLTIDDGSHRAIAMSLARLTSALAWIGELY
jgi:hypothetical protein